MTIERKFNVGESVFARVSEFDLVDTHGLSIPLPVLSETLEKPIDVKICFTMPSIVVFDFSMMQIVCKLAGTLSSMSLWAHGSRNVITISYDLHNQCFVFKGQKKDLDILFPRRNSETN